MVPLPPEPPPALNRTGGPLTHRRPKFGQTDGTAYPKRTTSVSTARP